MARFENQEIIENILINLAQMFAKWGLDNKDWLIDNKFFFRPYLHDHPATAFHKHFHILINRDKIPKLINGSAREIIFPANSSYLQDYLLFIDKFVEIQLFPKDKKDYKKFQQNCEIINLGNYKIQQLNTLNQFKIIFTRALRDQKSASLVENSMKKTAFSSVILNEELANYLYLGHLYAKKMSDLSLLRFIKKFQENRPKKVIATIINNIKMRGYVKLLFEQDKNIIISKKQILIVKYSSPKLIPVILKSGAIICEQGGINCHTAIVCREFNMPCAVGVAHIYDKFREGDYIEINPKNNCIYILKPYKLSR